MGWMEKGDGGGLIMEICENGNQGEEATGHTPKRTKPGAWGDDRLLFVVASCSRGPYFFFKEKDPDVGF